MRPGPTTPQDDPGGSVTVLEGAFLLLPHGSTIRGALAWTQGSILAVGESDQVSRAAGPGARRIRLDGALVLPGLWDCHTHMLSGALEQAQVQLRSARSRDEFVRTISAWMEANPLEPWVLGGGWDDALWGGEPPNKEWVDGITGGKPLFLIRYDMHSALANSSALDLAGIRRGSPDPPGGRILKDPTTGEPTGWLLEKAMDLVGARVPPMGKKRQVELLSSALNTAMKLGLTALQDLVWDFQDLEIHREVFSKGGPGIRVFMRTPIEKLDQFLDAREQGWPPGLVLHGVKGFLDGSLGSRTAWLREPYEGLTQDKGVSWVSDPEGFREIVFRAARNQVPVSLHAIGDAAIGMALEIYWECIQRGFGRAPLRIEHFQHPSYRDIQAMDHPRLVASMQPLHLRFDAMAAQQRLGPARARYSFPIRTLMGLGCTVVFGSDWSVADLNPLLGIHAAVTRQDNEGRWPDGWIPWERISVVQAIQGYTALAAKATGLGERSGELRPGWSADLTILDRDITSCSPEEICKARAIMTVVGGKIVHQNW